MRAFTVIALLILFSQRALAQFYSEGDTMTVVTLDRLNIRSSPKSQADKIGQFNNGDKVIILEPQSQITDTNFEFDGHWVLVRSLNDSVKGYVFDAFISNLPIINEMIVFNQKIENNRNLKELEFLSEILKIYSLRTFKQQSCETTYYNGSDGEGAHTIRIINLEKNNKLILHGYWEGNSTELELANVRPSEIYYLILNLLKYFPENVFTVDDKALRNARYSNYDCAVMGMGGCYVRIVKKGNNIVSIFFNFPCC